MLKIIRDSCNWWLLPPGNELHAPSLKKTRFKTQKFSRAGLKTLSGPESEFEIQLNYPQKYFVFECKYTLRKKSELR